MKGGVLKDNEAIAFAREHETRLLLPRRAASRSHGVEKVSDTSLPLGGLSPSTAIVEGVHKSHVHTWTDALMPNKAWIRARLVPQCRGMSAMDAHKQLGVVSSRGDVLVLRLRSLQGLDLLVAVSLRLHILVKGLVNEGNVFVCLIVNGGYPMARLRAEALGGRVNRLVLSCHVGVKG